MQVTMYRIGTFVAARRNNLPMIIEIIATVTMLQSLFTVPKNQILQKKSA